MQIKNIDHFVLTVADLEAAIAFYAGLLGMELDRSNGRYAFKFGGQKINVHRSKAEFLPAAAKPEFGSADFCLIAEGEIEAIHAELSGKNAPFEPGIGIVKRTGAMGTMQSIYLRDPDGNLVEISVYC